MIKIDHVNMGVENLEAAVSFYRDLFDFVVVESGRWDGTPWKIVRSGDSMLCLYEDVDARRSAHGPQIYHFGFRLTDRADFEARLEKYRPRLDADSPLRRPHSWNYYLFDPSGHEIELTFWDDDQIRFPAAG